MKNGEPNLRSTKIKFGIVMVTGFSLLASLMWYKDYNLLKVSFLSVAGFFAFVTLFLPKLLIPLEKYWMLFGEKMSYVVTTVIVSIVFVLVVCPIGITRRLFGVDKLRLKDNNRATMWEAVESAPNLQKPY